MPDIDREEYLELRQELEAMTHAELIDEVVNRMKFQQQIVIDNWHENKELRQEVQQSRQFITDTADQIEKWEKDVASIVAKTLYWKRSFYVLLCLVVATLALSCSNLNFM